MLKSLINRGDKKKLSLKLTGFNLTAKNNGSSDPLCEVSFGKHKWTTKVEKETVNPAWNEAFDIGAFDEKDSIEVKCFNREASSKEAMGGISISLKDYAKPGSFQKSYPLTGKKDTVTSGFIDFEFVVQGESNAQVFRCPLELVIAIQRSKYPDLIIPVFVRRSLEILRKNGISEEGLFRKSGSTGDINWAIETLDKDFDADIFTRIKDVHTLANLIKRFIRDIPGSVMPHEVEDAVRQAMDQKDPTPPIRAVLKQVPLVHKELLREVILFAADITKNPATKMNNMAIVLGPNLWPAGQGGVLNESKLIMEFAEHIISHSDIVFPESEKATAKEVAEALARIEKEVGSLRPESPKPHDKDKNGDKKDKRRTESRDSDKKRDDKKDDKRDKKDDRKDDKKDDRKREEDRKRDEEKKRAEEAKRAEEEKKSRDKKQAEEDERKKADAHKRDEAQKAAKFGDVLTQAKMTPQHQLESARDAEDDDLPGERNDIVEGDADDSGIRIYRVRGEWSARTAGGCLNFSSWRHNQQIFVSTTDSKTAKIKLVQDAPDLHHVGFYVAKAKDLAEKRQLLLTDEDIVHKEGFKAAREMYAEVQLQGGQMYVVIPCTFSPGEEAPYRLFIQTQGKLSARLSPKESDLISTEFEGEWNGRTAGGCRNHATCALNPQFLIKNVEKTVVTLILSQNDSEEFDTIGFYVVKTKDPKRRLTKFPAPDILAKTEFASPKEAASVFTLPEGGTFVIVPCTFEPGKEANFKLSILSQKPLRVSELKDEAKEVSLYGEWRPENCGGSPEFPTWRLNPQFFLMMFNTVKVSLNLRQREKKLLPIGFWIVKGQAADRVLVLRHEDVVAKVEPKETASVSLEIELEKSDLPYLIITFTSQPNQTARFQLTAANREENARSKGFACVGINSTWPKRVFHGEWRSGQNGGGDKSSESLLANPQYAFSLSQPARLVALVTSSIKGKYGVHILKTSDNAPLKALTEVVLESAMVGVEAAAEGALAAGAYIAIPYAEKGKDGNFDLALHASGHIDADVAGFDIIKVSKERSKTPLDKVFTTPFADVQLAERVGQGQLGSVYRGQLGGKQEVAVKRYSLLDANDKEYFKKEVGILRRAKHVSVAVFCGASLYEEEALIVYDWMPGSSLRRTLQQRKDMSWDQKLKIALDAAKGIIYLHNHKRVHRHLTSHNILIDKDLSAKVTDFAFPRRITTALATSLAWTAPEVLMQFSSFTDRSDTYSFGMILWELLSHQAPFEGFVPYQVVRAVDEREMPDMPSGTIKPFRRLLKLCWDRQPQNRPSIQMVLERLESFMKDGKAVTIVNAADSD